MKKLFYLMTLVLFVISGCENGIVSPIDMTNTSELDFSNNVLEKMPSKYYWYKVRKLS